MLGPGPQAPPQVQSHIATSQHQTSQLPQPTTPRGGGGGRDNWYRDDWFSRQDNTWQHDTHRDSYQVQSLPIKMRAPILYLTNRWMDSKML